MQRRTLLIIVVLLLIFSMTLSACIDDDILQDDTNSNGDELDDIDLLEPDIGNVDDQPDQPIVLPPVEEPRIEYIENKEVLALGNLNIRSAPSTQESSVLGILSKDTTIKAIGKYESNWYVIEYKGKQAYVTALTKYSKLVDKGYNVRSETIESIIKAGMTKLGTPYEYGSTRILLYNGNLNPNFTGKTFDCSAFVQYAFYMGAGIKLQGDSRSQSKDGQLVSLNSLQRGDLIFMTSTERMNNTGIERIGHVVIYLGDNKILHTYGTGGVRVQEYSSFWKGRSIHARRML